MKYTKRLPNGSIKYWRRVPDRLQSSVGKKQISRTLGKTEAEALANYANVHRHYETILSGSSATTTATEAMAIKDKIEAQFIEHGLILGSSGRTEPERIGREAEVDHILNRYVFDPETGHPDPDDLTPTDRAMVIALLEGTQAIEIKPAISDVFALYIAEKRDPDAKKHRKFSDRVLNMQKTLLKVVKTDMPFAELTRAHARAFRDALKATPSKSGEGYASHGTVKRNFGIVKAVGNFGILELDLDMKNPFNGIDLGKPSDNAIDLRSPLPKSLITKMYSELTDNQTLLDVWTLLHHTGAQSAEVLGLKKSDLSLSAAVPYFDIKPDGQRTVKNRSRIRSVPLVGMALTTAQRLYENTEPGGYLFPAYGPTEKHDNFSATCIRRMKKHRDNQKHVVYGLRHHMKDCLRQANVSERIQLALLGHSNERSASEHYGSAVSLEERQAALHSIALF